MMKKVNLIAIIITSVSSCFIYSAVVSVKVPGSTVPLKELGASDKKNRYKESIAEDISGYQYVYGAGMPVVCNYY